MTSDMTGYEGLASLAMRSVTLHADAHRCYICSQPSPALRLI